MKSYRWILSLFAALSLTAALLSGCWNTGGGDVPPEGETPDGPGVPEEVVHVDDWSGTWNALTSYSGREGFDQVNAGLSKSLGSNWEEALASDLISCRIQDTSLTVYTEPQDPDGAPRGDVALSLSYAFQGAAVDSDGTVWYQYETATECAYKYLLLQPVEGKVGGFRFFRFRYGQESLEELLEQSSWNPIMVNAEAEMEELQKQFGK